MKKNQLNLKSSLWMVFLLFFSLSSLQAQIAFTVSGNTNTTPNLATSYTSLANLLTDVNAIAAVSGNIFITGNSGSETAPNKGFTIGSPTLNAAMAGSTFRIYISGNGSSTINAGVGNATPSSPSPDGMVKLVGADRIYFLGFLLVDGNTTNPATMEFGIGLFKASPTDGCNYNGIGDNRITMQRVNFGPGSMPMPAGATGIIMVNSTPTAATTSLTPTSVAGSNSNNQIAGNIIDGGNNGIHLSGFAVISPYNDYNNVIGEANTIRNFGGGATGGSFATGITSNNQWNILITRNIIDNNTGTGVNTLYTLYGISVGGGGNNSNVNITYNSIKLQSASGISLLYGIFNSSGNGTETVNISDNIINLGYANGTFGNIRGIFDSSSPAVLNMNYNTIEGIIGVPLGGTGDNIGIVNSSNIATVNTIGNNVRNLDKTGTSGNLYGMQITASNWNATLNTIDNLKFSAVSSTGTIYGLNSNSTNTNLDSNTIKNLSIPSTGTIYGIYDGGSTGTKTINSNQIFNFATSSGGTGGSNFYGVYCRNGTVNVGNNNIYSLNISGNNATVASNLRGIRLDSPTNTVFNNKIYDLSANSTFGSISAVSTSIGNTTFYNNVISNLRAPNSTGTFATIGFITNGSASLYYNTILLNETVKNAGNSGSSAVFFNSSGTLISRNNILINTSVVSGTGRAVALNCANFATTYDASSNNNLLYASTIFVSGGFSDATLAAFKTRMVTRDQNSVTETTTPFTSTDGSSADFLRLADGVLTVANNNALPITSPAITLDYFGATRDTTTPDIGASEFNGLVCTLPVAYSVTGGGSACGTTVAVGLSNSETGMSYQLKLNGTATGTSVAGTGAALAFPNQTVSGTYTVDANNSNASCPQTVVAMTGTAIITIDVVSVGGSVAGTKTICFGQLSETLTLSANIGSIVRWEQTISPFTVWTTIANTTSTYNSAALSQTTHFRAVSKSGSCIEAVSSTAIITIITISATISQANVTCRGGADGAAGVTPQGGTAPYAYLWSNGASMQIITGLSAGSYSVIVTDANGIGCSFGIIFTISQPAAAVSGTTVVANVACNGGSNGAINLTPSGGTGPYTFVWNDGVTTEDRTGLAAGTYSVTIIDTNGCTSSISGITVTQPTSTITGTTAVTNVSCNSGTNGAITLTPSGGIAPYSYNWGGGVNTKDRAGLAAGSYSVTITDANGYTGTVSGISITQPTLLSGTATVSNNVFCKGGSTGYIILFPSGGTLPYTYNWGGGITTKDRPNVPAGIYSVTITDNNGCTKTITGITVTEPSTLATATTAVTNVSCNGNSNGAIILTPSGGTAPYTYNWGGGIFTKDRTGLAAATYAVTIRDDNGCFTTINNIIVTQPAVISGTTVVTDVSCNGGDSGTIELTPTGGTAPYTYNWGNNVFTKDRIGIFAGNYTVTITDANGCSGTVSGIAVTQPAAAVSGTTVITNISCNGANNGAINLTPSGGTGPYSYSWGNGVNTEDRTGLAAGTYSVTITDNNGCTGVVNGIDVTQPAAITPIFTQVAAICSGGTLLALPTNSNNAIEGTWLPAMNNTETTTYTFTPNLGDCGTTASMTIVVNTEAQPTRNTVNGTLCNGSTIGTLLSKFNNSANVLCYAAASGGSSLSETQLIAPVNANVTYYLTQVVNGCESARLAYNVFVNFINPPTAAATQSFCSGATVANLVATASSGASLNGWYTTATGGTALLTSTVLGSNTYYVGQSHISGCATQRTAVNVTISAVDGTITQTSGVLTATQTGATYQWYACPNTVIVGATNQTFTPTVVGDYRATITIGSCAVNSNCETVTTLGAADFDSTSFSYYPNPTAGILNVNYSSEISKIEVSNMLGQNVLSQTNNSKDAQIDMQFLPSGTYLVKISSDDKTKTIKIVKQ